MAHNLYTYIQLSLLALAVCFAVFFHGGNTQLFQVGAISCLVIGGLLTLLRGLEQGRLQWSKLHWGLLVYVALLVLNLFTSVFPENSRITLWAFLAMPLALFILSQLMTSSSPVTPDQATPWHPLLKFLLAPLLVSAVWGIGEFLTLGGRASGPGADPNSWASVLNLAFFVFAPAYLFAPKRYVLPLLVVLLVFAVASFMSYSRVGLVIFFAGLFSTSVLACAFKSLRVRAMSLLLLCVMSFASVQWLQDIETATRNDEGYTLNAEAYGWTVRFAQWDSAVRQYADYPLTGSGLGTFKVLYPQYRTLADATTAGNYVHNDYLQLLAEAGPLLVLALVLFLGFLMVQLLLCVRRVFITGNDEQNRRDLEAAVLIIAIGSVFVHGLMNFTFYLLLTQVLIGCALARLLWLLDLLQPRSIGGQQKSVAQVAAVLLAAYVLLTTYADAVSHDLVYRGGVIPLDRHDPDDQLKVFEILSTIRTFRGDSSTNRFAMATFYRTSFDDQPVVNVDGRRSLAIAASLEYQAGLELNPYADDVRGFFADFLLQNPWLGEVPEIYQSPELLLRGGLALTPIRIQAHVRLANYLELVGRDDEAYEILKAGLRWSPLKYNNYRDWRWQLRSMLFVRAQARQDEVTLQALLKSF
jgi:O-antigen ligase